jgi:hypothetical protein
MSKVYGVMSYVFGSVAVAMFAVGLLVRAGKIRQGQLTSQILKSMILFLPLSVMIHARPER